MDTKIRISLGSTANMEGFKQAEAAVGTLSKSANKAKGTINAAAASLSGLDGAAGQAVRSINSIIGGFAQMGIAGGIIAAAQVAMDKYKDACLAAAKAEEEAAAEALKIGEAAKKHRLDEYFGRVHEAIQKMQTSTAGVRDQFDQMVKSAKALQDAINGTDTAAGKAYIAELGVEKLKAMIDAQTDAARQVIEKEYDLKIANAELAEAKREYSQKVSDAKTAEMNALTSRNNAQKALDEAEQALINAKNAEANIAKNAPEDLARWTKQREDAEKAYADAQKKFQSASENYVLSTEKVAKAEEEAAEATASKTAAVLSLELKTKEATEKTAAAAKAEMAKTAAANDKAAVDAQAAGIQRIANKTNTDASNVIKRFRDEVANGVPMTKAYTDALYRLNRKIADFGEAVDAAAEETKNGGKKGGGNNGNANAVANVDMQPVVNAIKNIPQNLNAKNWAEAQEQARKHVNDLNKETRAMQSYLKGTMSADMAKQYQAYIRSTYNDDDIQKIGTKAMMTQLLSKKEMQDQKQAVLDILKVFKGGLK